MLPLQSVQEALQDKQVKVELSEKVELGQLVLSTQESEEES